MIYLLQHFLDESSKLCPHNVAVVFEGTRMSYEKLESAANQLANCLVDLGIKRQDRVLVFIPRCGGYVSAVMGILKADAIYVPVDAKSPISRLQKICNDCTPHWVVCNSQTIDKVAELFVNNTLKPWVLSIDAVSNCPAQFEKCFLNEEQIKKYSQKFRYYKNISRDIATILYTSGSTGQPKGVMITHANIIDYVEWAVRCFTIESIDKILNTAPFYFDMSIFDIFCALRTGASLIIASDKQLLFPRLLFNLIEQESITIWKGVSSLLMYLAKTKCLSRGAIPSLTRVLFAGEVLPVKYLIQWMQTYPEKHFFNGYGPTEATGISLWYEVKNIPNNINDIIPIGKPCDNTEVIILREDGELATPGEIGELCIRGTGVTPGYWNDPLRTEKSFVHFSKNGIWNDFIYKTGDLAKQEEDGNIIFVGRKDDQIKYMGYRIQASEIERALSSITHVKDVSVTTVQNEDVDIPEIVAFVETESTVEVNKLFDQVKALLPSYMTPKHIMKIERMPKTSRGKTDRQQLKQIFLSERH